ncbi:hypothetical protein pb186bvf_002459 [Paramecium bursaria]
MKQIISKNPFNGKILAEIPYFTPPQIQDILEKSQKAYNEYHDWSSTKKRNLINGIAQSLETEGKFIADLITSETGKPILQSRAEVKKAIDYCRYISENPQKLLQTYVVKSAAKQSYVETLPIGPVLLVTPFNFPLWICFKAAIPQLYLGNTIIHRGSDSTPLTSKCIEELLRHSGFSDNQFLNIFSSHDQLEQIVQKVEGVSFTGSSRVGGIMGAMAGKYLKRSVLELGGSDPFCVLQYADIDRATDLAIQSRITNCGQVCFSAKRFIIHKDKYNKFRDVLKQKLEKINIGDPKLESTQMGPLARYDLLENIHKQVQEGIQQGGKLILGGQPTSKSENEGNFYPPTIIEIKEKNILAQEETFGPIFPLIHATSNDEILRIANNTKYGLGAVVTTQHENEAIPFIKGIQAGMVFVNDIVKSDFGLPSGGIKQSGYGRECGRYGIQNFANIRTVWIQNYK